MVLNFEVECIENNPPPCADVDCKTLAGIKALKENKNVD